MSRNELNESTVDQFQAVSLCIIVSGSCHGICNDSACGAALRV